MRAVAHIEVDVGRGQAEVHEEGVGHVEIVVLAGVNDDGVGPGLLFERVVQRRDLHEVGPGRANEMDEHDIVGFVYFVDFVCFVCFVWRLRTLISFISLISLEKKKNVYFVYFVGEE